MKELNYFSVVGPGGSVIANFDNELAATQLCDRVTKVRLDQLERIRDVLTQSEYRGEYAFRSHSITVKAQSVKIMSSLESQQISDTDLVNGDFLIPSK